jgi:hypothetical protein
VIARVRADFALPPANPHRGRRKPAAGHGAQPGDRDVANAITRASHALVRKRSSGHPARCARSGRRIAVRAAGGTGRPPPPPISPPRRVTRTSACSPDTSRRGAARPTPRPSSIWLRSRAGSDVATDSCNDRLPATRGRFLSPQPEPDGLRWLRRSGSARRSTQRPARIGAPKPSLLLGLVGRAEARSRRAGRLVADGPASPRRLGPDLPSGPWPRSAS